MVIVLSEGPTSVPSALAAKGMTVGALNETLLMSAFTVTSVVPTRTSAMAAVGAAPIASASVSPAPTASALAPLRFMGVFIIDPFCSSRTVSVMVGRMGTGCGPCERVGH